MIAIILITVGAVLAVVDLIINPTSYTWFTWTAYGIYLGGFVLGIVMSWRKFGEYV